jgi:hypothetical protein
MIRKLLFAGVAVLSLVAPLAMPSPVLAGHDGSNAHRRHYHVMYRTCHREPWRCYGAFDCHSEAHRVARYLRQQGYQAHVEHH